MVVIRPSDNGESSTFATTQKQMVDIYENTSRRKSEQENQNKTKQKLPQLEAFSVYKIDF